MVIERPDTEVDHWPSSDPRWPRLCAECGRPFHEDDPRNVIHETLFQWEGTDIQLTLSEAPPGAMWDAEWHQDRYPPGPDGIRLLVRLPGHVDWQVDRPPTDEERKNGRDGPRVWERTGTPCGASPTVSVTPSVVTKDKHGWHGVLKNGRLIEIKPSVPMGQVLDNDECED